MIAKRSGHMSLFLCVLFSKLYIRTSILSFVGEIGSTYLRFSLKFEGILHSLLKHSWNGWLIEVISTIPFAQLMLEVEFSSD